MVEGMKLFEDGTILFKLDDEGGRIFTASLEVNRDESNPAQKFLIYPKQVAGPELA